MIAALFAPLRRKLRQSIQFRLTCYFLLVLFPLIAIGLYVNISMRASLEEQIGERGRLAMTASLEYLELFMRGVEELSALIATDRDMNAVLDGIGPQPSAEQMIELLSVLGQLSKVSAANRSIEDIAIVHEASGLLISSRSGAYRVGGIRSHPWFREMAESFGRSTLYSPSPEEKPADPMLGALISDHTVTLIRQMDAYRAPDAANVLLLSVRKETLLHTLNYLLPSAKAELLLLDASGRVVTGSGRLARTPVPPSAIAGAAEGKAEASNRLSVPGRSETMFALRTESADLNWSLIVLQPEAEIFARTKKAGLFTMIIIGVSLLLAVWIAWIVYSGIASPLSDMMKGMNRLQRGRLDARLPHGRHDEIGYLMDAFNAMAEEQQKLIKDGYEKRLRLLKAEMKLIQAQIHPHFLYNTLDSIYSVAMKFDVPDIGGMVLHLSRFFRYSLGKGKESYTLADTVAHLNDYIQIQRFRFASELEVVVELAADVRELPLLKLLLQPIVENAMLHGLEPSVKPGRLGISAHRSGDMLVAEVTDNGVGIPPDRLAFIQAELGKIRLANLTMNGGEEGTASELFGLRNVKSRLQLYYGAQADLRIDSEKGAGTRVTLVIPIDALLMGREEAGNETDDRRG